LANLPPFRLDDEPDERVVRFLEDQIYLFNAAATGIDDGKLLAIVLRDDDEIAAGLYGFTWGGVLEVKDLWVREDLRGLGHGTRLLAQAEREAVRRGCHAALLDTHSFQSPEFYQRRGYEVIGVAPDYPPGHKKYFFRKRLEQEVGLVGWT
jgi:GNAT superfamily N-acetyltransferase